MRYIFLLCACALPLVACSASHQAIGSDLSVALDAASLAESAYASRPGANPKTVADLARLLASAQAAVQTWTASTSPGDQAIAAAAVAALIEYESSAGIAP